MRKAIIATSVAAVALGAMVSQASANVSATCVKPGTISAHVSNFNPAVDHQVFVWTNLDSKKVAVTVHNGVADVAIGSPEGDVVVYLQRQDGGTIYQSAVVPCKLPPVTPPPTPLPPGPKPPVVPPMPPKKPTPPPIHTSRKVFTIKTVACSVGHRSYRIDRTRVTITRGGNVIRIAWSQPVKVWGKVCPLPGVTG